jgi:iron complex transport system substrate-binding protein
MNRLSRLAVLVILGGFLFPGLACSESQATPTATAPSAVTDQLGRTVKLDKVPQRIISLGPANTEILYALGLADRVVAVTSFDNYPPDVKQKPNIGGFSNPNLEQVVSLSPDLVVAAPIHEKQVIPQLESKGITVLALAPKTIDDVEKAIALVGQVTGSSARAGQVVSDMEKRVKAVTDKAGPLSVDQRPRVLYLVWHDPLMGSGRDTFHDELIRKAGGANVITEPGYPNISLESVVQANPDVILAGVGMGQGQDAPLKFAREESRLRDVSARLSNRVHGVDTDVAGRAGPRIVDALETFAKLIHPELFK